MNREKLSVLKTLDINGHTLKRFEKIGILPKDQVLLADVRQRLNPETHSRGELDNGGYNSKYAPSWNSLLLAWGVAEFDTDRFNQIVDQAEDIIHHFTTKSWHSRRQIFYSRISSVSLLLASRLYMEQEFIDDPELTGIIEKMLYYDRVEETSAWETYLAGHVINPE